MSERPGKIVETIEASGPTGLAVVRNYEGSSSRESPDHGDEFDAQPLRDYEGRRRAASGHVGQHF